MGDFLLGTALPLLLFSVGAYFAVTVGWRWLLAPRRVLGGMLVAGRGNGTSPWRAMTVALGGTLGVGNITGVAAAIAVGGAGAGGDLYLAMTKHLLPYIRAKKAELWINFGDHLTMWDVFKKNMPELEKECKTYFND